MVQNFFANHKCLARWLPALARRIDRCIVVRRKWLLVSDNATEVAVKAFRDATNIVVYDSRKCSSTDSYLALRSYNTREAEHVLLELWRQVQKSERIRLNLVCNLHYP